MRTRIKICGITNIDDALMATGFGADALGFVCYRESSRYVSPDVIREITQKLPPFVTKVGVFVNDPPAFITGIVSLCGLDGIQIHTSFPGLYRHCRPGITIMACPVRTEGDIRKAMELPGFPLLDCHHDSLYGGTGKRFNWTWLKGATRPYILAGGINPENIQEALALKPYAVDVSSGVEKEPGIKDPARLRDLLQKVREQEGS